MKNSTTGQRFSAFASVLLMLYFALPMTAYSAPQPSGIQPNVGSTAGGRGVDISGSGFQEHGMTRVTLGGVEARVETVYGDDLIVCYAPPHEAGVVDVTVINPDGSTGILPQAFTYKTPPTVTSVTPDHSLSFRTTMVTITGTGFVVSGKTLVSIGDDQATQVVVHDGNPSYITCVAPTFYYPVPGDVAVDIWVSNPDGIAGVGRKLYTYTCFSITYIIPSAASVFGGAQVEIYGPCLINPSGHGNVYTDNRVEFDGLPASNILVPDYYVFGELAGYLHCTIPAHPSGYVDVTVINSGGTSIAPGMFQYTKTLHICSVRPKYTVSRGGTQLMLKCVGLPVVAQDITVSFGGAVPAKRTVIAGEGGQTIIWCKTPDSYGSGSPLFVSARDAGSEEWLAGMYPIFNATEPSIISATPASGTCNGGEAVTITGSGFDASGVKVLFGDVESPSVQVDSSTQITCTAPVHEVGPTDVWVINQNELGGVLRDAYTFTPVPGQPYILSVQPNTGLYDNETPVTITGDGFDPATPPVVSFADEPAAGVTVGSPTSISCAVPKAAAPGTVGVSVEIDGHRYTRAVAFTYVDPPDASASFNSDIQSGGPPYIVQFTDLSTGPPASWQWQFGDGTTSTDQNPTHSYAQAGDYVVSLTVKNAYDRGNSTSLQITVPTPGEGEGEGEGEVAWGDIATPPGVTPIVLCDNKPGGQDAVLILKWYAGLINSLESCPDGTSYTAPSFPPNADVNADQQLGGQDASLILQYYAGLITCFPADPQCLP